ncbi:MAG: MBL fold metallo-hydrolase [Smithella sp.]|jgi:glyoxylase-like metal-dependent hydrolase (beta-lactamase superfamily II)
MKVYFLATGFGNVAKGLFVQGAGFKSVRFPILSVLIERNHDLVLFDTGIGTRINEEMRPPIYWGNLFFHRCVMRTQFMPQRDALVHQLPRLGFQPSDVKKVIISHLHWDHAGGMRDFPHAHFIVNRKEWNFVTQLTGVQLYKNAFIKEQFGESGLDIELMETDLSKPFLNFPASHDIFGDGSMVLVDLPGHSPGLMGMFLTMPSGRRFLFSADTFYFPEGLEQRMPKSKLMQSLVSEGMEAGSSIDKVYDLMNSEPELEIVGSHDYRLPGRYDLAPKYYT